MHCYIKQLCSDPVDTQHSWCFLIPHCLLCAAQEDRLSSQSSINRCLAQHGSSLPYWPEIIPHPKYYINLGPSVAFPQTGTVY